MTTETFVLVIVTNLATLTLSTLFYASRVSELRVEHTREKAEMNAERTMTDRLYGEIPIDRLIGLETFNDGEEQ